jgi:hypothetical protein
MADSTQSESSTVGYLHCYGKGWVVGLTGRNAHACALHVFPRIYVY